MSAGVIFGGPSPEHDVSILTGLQAARALLGAVEVVYWDKLGLFWLLDPASEGADFLDGPRERQVPKLCRWRRILCRSTPARRGSLLGIRRRAGL